MLALDSTKVQHQLGWRNHVGFQDTISATIEWKKWVDTGLDPREATLRQIRRFYEASSD